MVVQPTDTPDPSPNLDNTVVLFRTRSATKAPTRRRQQVADRQGADRPVPAAQGRLKRRVIRQVEVLEVSGRLGDVAEELDRAVQVALAEVPKGVVCDLSAVLEGSEPGAVEILASAGRHVRDWPGIPVAVACPDPQVREALRAQPLGEHLIVTASLFSAVTAVLATPAPAIEWRRLAPHPTASRASREFVARALQDWRLDRVSPFATMVASELVASSSINAGTSIDLSVSWNRDGLRLTVRDHGPGLPGQQPQALYLHGRQLTLVAGISRSFGVLPTADGGKVVWAVLDAPRQPPSNNSHESAAARQASLILSDAHGLAILPFDPGSGANR